MTACLLWFRRDLRLTDNPALIAALERGTPVIPVYVHDPASEDPWAPGAASRSWLHHSLTALAEDLARRGSRLVVRSGPALQTLRALIGETSAGAVAWNRLHEPAIAARDARIEAALASDGIETSSHNAALWSEPGQIATGSGGPYRVFTPFWRALAARLPDAPVSPAPERIPGPRQWPAGIAVETLALRPSIAWDQGFYDPWQPGEAGAYRRLRRFLDEDLRGYGDARDRPADDGCSRLSPHLHFGEIGPRQVLQAVRRAQAGGDLPEHDAEHFLRELGWREFAHHLLHHFPQTPDQPLNAAFAAMPWRRDRDHAADLQAWQRGRTGIPIVDAGMRELWASGWMHNRVRMIVASLLTKNLLIPWQQGARWFWDTLVDADLASNTLGWQWVAGCGADAAPYFRIFNPVLQSQKFDAGGRYIRRWVPELAHLPDKAVHAPWTMRDAAPRDYPAPIVDLAASRQRALDAFARMREDG
ncbi:cryptochrome/photolyase family protein [Sinimarinibacterium flocculans]|uniref:Deoxyribodipyrimidine photo-lyase n=1 Tax=Sinimarinibacterium flocculans TaxID=985250 RepID=A0A318EFP8_9GAMM|nr:deoxyribodipyrimidine photo-lyase [Sinimarinibacterium flocculans]PXV69546.1 deoxyribodipyrimidine photo-lyase type I [Sinimarinibacterium flocculans]